MLLPDTLLIASCRFGPRLDALQVADAIAKGVSAAGRPAPDVCAIEERRSADALARSLDALAFDERMHRARALVVAAVRLDRETLRTSAAFEIATRARQAGVPAYAIAGESSLDAFDARLLDLQLILTARHARGLSAAGRTLARLV